MAAKFAIVTNGMAMGRRTRTQDPRLYDTRQEAEDEIADRVNIGDEAAIHGRMKIEEVDEAEQGG